MPRPLRGFGALHRTRRPGALRRATAGGIVIPESLASAPDARCTPSVVRRQVALRRFVNGSDAGIADPLEALPGGGGRGGRDVVYGDVDGSLVFVPRERAEWLAAVQRALWSSSTWGEVRDRMPAGAYQELLEISGATELPDFEEFYAGERRERPDLAPEDARREYLALPPGERRPEPGDPFDAGDIGVVCDGDWPGWPAQEMLDWIPRPIQERWGTRGTSFVSGDCLLFPREAERDLVAALAALGYACERDDALVRRASGYAE